jgi:hypothetical protein
MGSFSVWHLLIIGVVVVVLVVAFIQWQGSTRSLIAAGKYSPQYGADKFVGALTVVFGSVLLAFGVVGVFAGVTSASSLASEHPNLLQGLELPRQAYMVAAVAGLGFSVLLVLIGLLMTSVGKNLRVTADAANRLGEIVALMKSGVATPILQSATQVPQQVPRQVPQQVPTGKFCSGCGAAAVDAGSAFCGQCGAKL